jgi:hypothetical protein
MKENKKIDKLIKHNIDVEKTSFDFSNRVMQQIMSSDLKKERALTNLLNKHTLENQTLEFTSKVMLVVKRNSTIVEYQPVISKKAWYFIASVFVLLMVFIVPYFDITFNQLNYKIPYLTNIKGVFSFNVPNILSSPLFAMSVFTLSFLLLLDYFIRNRNFTLKA